MLDILAAVSGVDKKTLWLKFDFIMTDATAHNMEVEMLLAEELDSTHMPKHLLCHVHPVFLFLRALDAIFKEIELSMGREKIFASFNVTPDNQESVMTQFLDCCSRLICHDFDHKPWNRAGEFDIFIR